MHRDTITKEIVQKCIDQGMTQTEMAVRLDASFETIHRLLKQYNLKPAYNHDTGKYDEEKMKRCLQQGMTMQEISEKFGVHYATISKWIKEHDLDKYRPPRPHKSNVDECRTCIYRERDSATLGKCGYLMRNGHSRNMGQPEEKCSKYVKGKRGRKSAKRKIRDV